MLTIKRRHTAIKAITAGSVAFAIGLTGATAFIGDNFQADTPVFNKEQSTTEAATDPKPISDTSADKAQQGSESDSTATSSQPAGSGSTWAPAPASSMTTQSSTLQTTAPSSTTEAPATTNPDSTSGSTTDSSDCTLNLCVDETLDPVGNLLP